MNEASCAATVVQRADESRSRTCVSWWEGQKRVVLKWWRRRRRKRRKIGTLQRCITIGTLYFQLASPTTKKTHYLEEMKSNARLTSYDIPLPTEAADACRLKQAAGQSRLTSSWKIIKLGTIFNTRLTSNGMKTALPKVAMIYENI